MTAILITRQGHGPPRVFPRVLRLTPRSFGVSDGFHPLSGRLSVPAGWEVEQAGPLAWFVRPKRIHLDRRATFHLEFVSPIGRRYRWSRQIDIKLDLQTSFDIETHPAPFRNSRRALGTILPSLSRFRRTYLPMPHVLERLLFRGLYAEIVRLGGGGAYGGGLCSGMARWAGLRSLRDEKTWPPTEEALDQIAVLHGRQLTDRALLSGARWFLRGSPRKAYRAVRADALRSGESRRALDIGVPKPWRRDVVEALVREGHSIVPFRVRQESPEIAYLDCYDPNRYHPDGGAELQTIEFRLDRDRYAYQDRVAIGDRAIGMIAVPHAAYARRGSAGLALLGSAIWLLAKRVIDR